MYSCCFKDSTFHRALCSFGVTRDFMNVMYSCSEVVTQGTNRFAYTATAKPGVMPSPCVPHSLADFAMERYSGFFSWKHEARVFRTWHPSWMQIPTDACIEDDSLLTSKFPWFKEAILTSSNFATGFEHVWLGRAHALAESRMNPRQSGHV